LELEFGHYSLPNPTNPNGREKQEALVLPHLIAFLFPTKIAFAYNVGGNKPSNIHKAQDSRKKK
jgi:hypothetical protein